LHIPAYIEKFDEFKAKGVNAIYVFGVNDAFVMKCVLVRTDFVGVT
jgi:2-Cys peroxiredoxin 5